MIEFEWIAIAVGLSVVSIIITGLLVARRYNKKIEGHSSIKEAIKEAQDSLDNLMAKSKEVSESLSLRRKELEDELKEVSESLSLRRKEFEFLEAQTKKLVDLETRSAEIEDLLKNRQSRYEDLLAKLEENEATLGQGKQELHKLKSEIDLYTRIAEFIDFGIFEEPKYLYETSERYNAEIKLIRDQQKQMIVDKKAVELPRDIQVNGSSQKGASILNGQSKMILQAFNIECDLLIEKISPSNFARTLERIEKKAESLENSAISLMCGISTDYIKLKFEECKLYYEYKLKKAEEQEEQRIIREQMREEQKAIREYELAIAEAEREERMYEKLLDKARKALSDASEIERAELNVKISLLEEQLIEAKEKEARAKSMAEQTRRGHVYIISNIGSFGDGVHKIGLTRRLDPLDRVKELGDASVPFHFDVHAIIYNEDAPALESKLHNRFKYRRVNAVNRRKEFFRVKLHEIKEAVEEIVGSDAEFKMTALAEDYYETLRLQGGMVEAG